MRWLLILTSLSVSLAAVGGSYEEDDEMCECYFTIVCEMNKFQEFEDMRDVAGPELTQESAGWISQVTGIEDPADTREYWTKFENLFCEEREKAKKLFKDYISIAGEHMLELCTDPEAEMCIKGNLAADEFTAILAKYKATGACKVSEAVPGEMIPGGMDSIG